jgi:hypothetical protein
MGVDSRSGRTFIVGLCVICAAALLLRYPVADLPLERDEGEYAYIAQRWLHGEVPYRDAFDQKPPGVFVVYALIESTIGVTPTALHWGAQIYTLAPLIVIAIIGRWFVNERTGLLAALFAAYMTVDVCVLGNAANTEMFMILPLAGGFLCTVLALDSGQLGWAVAAGVLSCLAMQFKQVALQNAVYNGLLLLALGRPRLRLCVAFAFGGVVALAPTVLYFWSIGALHDFYDCVVGHNLAYAQRVPLEDYPVWFWYNFSYILDKWWLIFSFAVLGLVLRSPVGKGPLRPRLILGSWLLFSFLGVCTGGYFRNHYFFQIIPAIAVLAGRGLALLAAWLPPSRSAVVAWSAAAVAIALGIFVAPNAGMAPDKSATARLSVDVTAAPTYYMPGNPIQKVDWIYGNCPFGESIAVADYVRSHSNPDESIFVYGSEPQIPYYAARKSASRYIFVYPLMTPFPDTRDRQAGVLDEVHRNRPRYIVVAKQESSFFDDDLTPHLLQEGLTELLNRDYRLVGFTDTGDTEVKPFSGAMRRVGVPRPEVEHTLAVWRRVD